MRLMKAIPPLGASVTDSITLIIIINIQLQLFNDIYIY
jgi:hypothetical protein